LRAQKRAEAGIAPHETVFAFVGDLRKGARSCIEALAGCGEDSRILFVSRSIPGPYKAFAEHIGISRRVLFLPHTNRIEEVYAAADALLLPSPYDTFGMVVTEAMACGLPVIVSRTAGASELITHGRDGFILRDAGDTVKLSRYMRALLEDRTLATEVGRSARRTVEHLSWDEIAHRTLEVYSLAPRALVG
jgi:UDP-glucose:(heptosyl)LPS alpha-1,3-glucosyltransferase